MDTFVNPIPGIRLDKMFSFDFPLATKWDEYRISGCKKNIDLNQPNGPVDIPTSEVPTQEGIYGKLGVPARNQGFPSMAEYPYPEAEDPYAHDQIIDIDRAASFDHTGRLSGSFVKYLIQQNHVSNVKITVVPLTNGGNPILLWQSGDVGLVPQPKAPNVWYWEDPNSRNELIFTAHAIVQPADWKRLKMEPGIYNLIINWEFWAINGNRRERMPVSGFDESMTFELSAPTIDL